MAGGPRLEFTTLVVIITLALRSTPGQIFISGAAFVAVLSRRVLCLINLHARRTRRTVYDERNYFFFMRINWCFDLIDFGWNEAAHEEQQNISDGQRRLQ